jgi:hypothetical protein
MLGEGQVVRGIIADRPWGPLLGGLALGNRTVQVTVRADDKVYRIAFDRGAIVAASSPLAQDAVTRIALASHHIAASQVNEIKRCIAAAPGLDDVDVLAASVGLDPEATRVLRTKVITQRAARTFAIDEGEYEIEDRMPVAIGASGIDVRSVIFLGARMNLSEERLRAYLRQLSARFVLKPGVFEDLERYGFSSAERPLLDALRTLTSLAELEASHRDVDPRGIQAVVYALASCDALAQIELAPEPVAPAPAPVPAPLPVAPPAAAPLTFPDAQRVAALMQEKPQTDVIAKGRVNTVSVTERVRRSTRNPLMSRDELPPERARTSTLLPPGAKQPTRPLLPATSPRSTRSALTAPRPLTEASPVVPSPLDALEIIDEPPTQARPKPRSPSDSHDSFKHRSIAEGTPGLAEDVPSGPQIAALSVDDLDSTLTRALVSLDLEIPEEQPAESDEEASTLALAPVRKKPVTPGERSMLDTFKTQKVTTVRPSALARHEVIALINERTAMLGRGADHFTLLGLPVGAPIEDVHAAYVELARHLRPQRLAELGIKDEAFVAQSLLAQIGIAFTVLTDRVRRPEYLETLRAKQSNRPR